MRNQEIAGFAFFLRKLRATHLASAVGHGKIDLALKRPQIVRSAKSLQLNNRIAPPTHLDC
jgi:hypothetical protein